MIVDLQISRSGSVFSRRPASRTKVLACVVCGDPVKAVAIVGLVIGSGARFTARGVYMTPDSA